MGSERFGRVGLICRRVQQAGRGPGRRTGQRKWKQGRYGSGQTLLVEDLLLIQSEGGAVALAEARPDAFREVARLPVFARKTWNYPTLAGRYLLVRNDQEAACYELPLEGASPATAGR